MRTDQDAPWWRAAVVYQVYPRSFADSDGDGVGDLAGIREHLDHLEWLGVDALWLSPFQPSPMDDNGYDISDYRAVDPIYGTLDDFDALVADAHDRGIRIVLDLVANHTSDEHPWFRQSRSASDHPRRDWYWWRRPRDGHVPGQHGAEPTNWGSFFSGSAWAWDPTSDEYYLHLFSPKQPDLNWENPAVRQAIHDVARWWLRRGVDGFRMDVINLVSKDPALPDGVVRPGEEYGDLGRSVVDGPRVHEYLAEFRREVFGDRTDVVLLVGEAPGTGLEEARRYTHPDRRELDMVFHFEHVNVDRGEFKWDLRPFSVPALRRVLATWQVGLADCWNALYWDNHDQPRVVSRFGDVTRFRDASAKALATVLHLQRGTPFVFQGDEIGMANYPFTTIEDFDDIESVNHYRRSVALGVAPEDVLVSLRAMSRDNGRTPMQWDDGPQAGFTRGRPWRPVNPDHVDVNVAAQREVPGSVLHHYRDLIRLRHEEPVVVEGTFSLLAAEHDHLFAFTREHGDTTLVVVANLSSGRVGLPDDVREACEGAALVLGERAAGVLDPWESRVLRRTRAPEGAT
ncbi:alpha-glucosidase [Nocardioides carbamazepini]|uniref:glycoside hydrolase family 13 protein n=1 Tax=Nocardioides carbamazepini TaxID=2854259 RepID=UPI00214A56D3|nr:alpha-glucosidase [Nocardioides carbamazepini]MCR1781590.1 alpha-glucosidase [Nocardioides carbamazepini]